MIQKRHKIQIGRPDNIVIILVGCGGTGSFVALNLARFAVSNPQLKIRLLFVDFDQVEEKNIGRQYFCPADVGRPKAQVLATRLNLAFGLQITPIVGRFEAALLADYRPDWSANGRLTLVVGCVDNPEARRTIGEAIEDKMEESIIHNQPLWWLDAGNDEVTGQVLIGNTLNPSPLLSKMGDCIGLPLPSVQEPQLVAPLVRPVPDEAALSCADLVALGTQARTINYQMAAWLDVYLERLLVSHDLDIMRTTINQRLGVAQSQAITGGQVVEGRLKAEDYRPEGGEDAPAPADLERVCPDCGRAGLIAGRDVIEGEMEDIVFCPYCDWQELAVFEGLGVRTTMDD